jgi:DNA-binding response OmpR family regulator
MSTSLISKSILCVQTAQDDRALIAELLPRHDIVFACNGHEGLCQVGRRAYDAYILDLWLPDWSGARLCAEIRKYDVCGPILFYTAAARNEDRNRAMRAGASAYLCKPVDPVRLQAQLRVLLELADLESIQARVEEERAIQAQLEYRAAEVFKRVGEARLSAMRAMEQIARAKASLAFGRAGGTHANFERWWPEVFRAAWANTEAHNHSALKPAAESRPSREEHS